MALIPFFKPSLFRKDMDAVLQTMVDEKIGPGEKKRSYVRAFSSYLKKKDGIALRTLPDALSASFQALHLEKGDSVALSVFTPLVYLEALSRAGLKAYPVDADDELMPDCDFLKDGLRDGVKALILFLPLGNIVSDYSRYRELGIPVIEDITEAAGSLYGGEKPGRGGDIVICSTEENSPVSTAGGCAVFSDNDEIIESLRSSVNPYTELPDMNAALGIVQLDKLDSVIQRRRAIYRIYLDEALRHGRTRVVGMNDPDFETNAYSFSLISSDRPEDAIEIAKKYSVPVHKTFSKAVGSRYLRDYERFSSSYAALTRCISFPLYPLLSNSEIQQIRKSVSVMR